MDKDIKKLCKCPYCDAEIKDKDSDECGFCKVKITLCKSCGYPVSSHIDKCPECGEKL